jgi:hypothetical protein
MQKCRSLDSKKVSISLLRGLGLGRENERLGLVRMWEGLGLASQGLAYITGLVYWLPILTK